MNQINHTPKSKKSQHLTYVDRQMENNHKNGTNFIPHSLLDKEKGCKFSINSEICGKKISDSQVTALLAKGKTGVIKGFVSPKSGKSFDAYIVWHEKEQKIKLEFPKKGQKS